MDTPQFCGQVCHQVMKPEFVAYQSAPHARVACVECHVAAGAAGLAEAKLSGVRRVVAVLRHSHARPIPPLRGGRLPARETCERCHWPEKTHGDVIKRVAEYANDERNSETITTFRLKVGGGSEPPGAASGIHWHINVANKIEYLAADEMGEVIAWVRLEDRNGVVREYVRPGARPETSNGNQRRRMDCMDCHNRPSHPIAPSAARAVDEQLALEAIPKDLPFVRRESIRALEVEYPTEGEAMAGIARALGDFYRGAYKDVSDALGHSKPFGYTRNSVDADASFDVFPFTALKVGYGFERDDRRFRLFETTDDHIFRTALDTAGHQYVSFRLGYEHGRRTGSGLDWNRSTADYTYLLPSNTSLGPLVPLPQVLNELRRASVEVSYSLTSRLSAGFAYAYEDFEVNDFQTSPGFAVGSRTLPDGIVLGYYLRPYTAHTGGVRLTVFW